MVVVILAILLMKRDIVVPCIVGIFAMGLIFSGSFITAIQTIYNAMIFAGNEFWGIIVIISLVVAMSKGLQEIGADALFMSPIKKMMINPTFAFFGIGFTMMIISWLVWPSPAVPLVGAVLLPAALLAGLSPMWAAVAMNLFGHGIALSSDFFIQGAPAISSKGANLDPSAVISASVPLWLTMSIVTVAVAFFMMKREYKNNTVELRILQVVENKELNKEYTKSAKFIAVITPLSFLADIVAMLKYDLRGGDATALVGGTALIIMLLITLTSFKFNVALDKVVDYLKDGFGFGIKVFAPVIIIAGFFFMGNGSVATSILGEGAPAILNDISLFISERVAMNKFSAILAECSVAIITGLDGSGFSGLPIVGSLAYTFSNIVDIDIAGLTALGQIITVWFDGGTVIPWAVIPVAAICDVKAADLARKNLIPVMSGIVATVIVALIIL
jgi:hypothetical protein